MVNKKLKILIVHNYYRGSSPSGEDVVFHNECELLRKYGHQVVTYTRSNDEISNINALFNLFFSKKTYSDLKTLIAKEKPDLAHFHNIWYAITPSAYAACKDMNIPIVQTLHNFRFICANGLLLSKNQICERCLKKDSVLGFFRACYKNSHILSLPIAKTISEIRKNSYLFSHIDAFICLTNFQKKKYIEAGFPQEKFFIKPNFIPRDLAAEFCLQSKKRYAVFFGRLSPEKGIHILVRAWENLNYPLFVIGSGPLQSYIEEKSSQNTNIIYLGRKTRQEIASLVRDAMLTIVPSICYEIFPLTVLESYASCTPTGASKIGGLEEIVIDDVTGFLFPPKDWEKLREKVVFAFNNPEKLIQYAKNAREIYETTYTPEKNYKMLMEIYESVLREHK
ncbi:MAG: glycosyltransferase family 4 protein [candidate division WOR-3 bacterium]